MTNGRPPRDVVFLLAGAAVLYIAFWLAVRLRSLLVMLIAEFEGDRIRRFRQNWNEVELLDGLGLLPA